MTTVRDEYKECIIQHIESGEGIESIDEKYNTLLTQNERNNIIWHVINLYVPNISMPQPKKRCGCGK